MLFRSLNPAFVPFAIETARYLTHAGRSTPASEARANESNPAATSVDQFTSAIERVSRVAAASGRSVAREAEDRQKWWQVGIVVMLVALAGEALIGRRTT